MGEVTGPNIRSEEGVKGKVNGRAVFLGVVLAVLFSVSFTLVLWKYIGFGTPFMPAVSLILGKVYSTMMATGDFVDDEWHLPNRLRARWSGRGAP